MKSIIGLIVATLWAALNVHGAEPVPTSYVQDPHYGAREFNFAVLGTIRTGDLDGRTGGLALSGAYWIHERIGVGAEVQGENLSSSFVDRGSVDLRVRFPFGRWALHVAGGPSYDFEHDHLGAHVWAGPEFRITRSLSLIGGLGWLGNLQDVNQLTGRAGIQVQF